MSTTRISPKHQVTIPKDVFDTARLEIGDLLEASYERDRIVLTPKRLIDKQPTVKLTPSEQRSLKNAQKKIDTINTNPLNSKGLTRQEISVAVKVGLILEDQAYFWTEEWQKNLRSAERDTKTNNTSPIFSNADDALIFLHQQHS